MASKTPSPTNPPALIATLTPTQPRPFVTLPGVWMLRIRLYRDAAPEVVSLLELDEGRLTASQMGAGQVLIQDDVGHPLYELYFQPNFVRWYAVAQPTIPEPIMTTRAWWVMFHSCCLWI